MPNGSLSLAEFPAAMVRLKCLKCGRSGQHWEATLIGKYGADIHPAGAVAPDRRQLLEGGCPRE